jgi:hypothetical protein
VAEGVGVAGRGGEGEGDGVGVGPSILLPSILLRVGVAVDVAAAMGAWVGPEKGAVRPPQAVSRIVKSKTISDKVFTSGPH